MIAGAGITINVLIFFLLSGKPCDHYLPDIEDVQTE